MPDTFDRQTYFSRYSTFYSPKILAEKNPLFFEEAGLEV